MHSCLTALLESSWKLDRIVCHQEARRVIQWFCAPPETKIPLQTVSLECTFHRRHNRASMHHSCNRKGVRDKSQVKGKMAFPSLCLPVVPCSPVALKFQNRQFLPCCLSWWGRSEFLSRDATLYYHGCAATQALTKRTSRGSETTGSICHSISPSSLVFKSQPSRNSPWPYTCTLFRQSCHSNALRWRDSSFLELISEYGKKELKVRQNENFSLLTSLLMALLSSIASLSNGTLLRAKYKPSALRLTRCTMPKVPLPIFCTFSYLSILFFYMLRNSV